jgi:hypothetical protein
MSLARKRPYVVEFKDTFLDKIVDLENGLDDKVRLEFYRVQTSWWTAHAPSIRL